MDTGLNIRSQTHEQLDKAKQGTREYTLNKGPIRTEGSRIIVIHMQRAGRVLWLGFTSHTGSAIFNVHSLLTVILLLLCTCTCIRSLTLSVLDRNKTELLDIFGNCATIGERKSPHATVWYRVMAFSLLFTQ
ncbi:protein kish-A-like [Tenrec ecaudatus]|uniref:protein kish-A-like n=1 Tax=Tenrec ecaudatus TaxID=94439 RepID=UPI003F5996EB